MKIFKLSTFRYFALAVLILITGISCESDNVPANPENLISQISKVEEFLDQLDPGTDIGQIPPDIINKLVVKKDWATLILERENNDAAFDNAVRILEEGMEIVLESEIRPGYPSLEIGSTITAPADAAFAPIEEFTVECRIKLNSFDSQINVVNLISTEHQYDPPNNGGFSLRYHSSNAPNPGTVDMVLGVGLPNPIWQGVNAGIQLTELNKWYHIAATYNATTLICKIYIDGELKGEASVLQPMKVDLENGGPPLGIGGSNFFGGRDMEGQIIDVRIWNKELSEEQINAKKDDFLSGIDDLDNLNAYWPFNIARGNRILDETGQHTAVLSGVDWVEPN